MSPEKSFAGETIDLPVRYFHSGEDSIEVAMSAFLTAAENIVIDLMCEWIGESRFNRTIDEYIAMRQKVPKIAAVHAYITQRLKEIADRGTAPYQICRFRAGDKKIKYEPYPRRLSIEVVRTAVKKFFGPLYENSARQFS